VAGRAAEGATAGLVAVADVQTAGRGRWGRSWEAPAGTALLCSVLLRPGLPPERWPLAGAAMGLAAREAVAALSPAVPVALKWPNDVVVGDAKLGGVLAEALPGSGAVVVGLGLNLTWAPPGAAQLGQVDRDVVLDAVLAALGRLCGDWAAVVGVLRAHCTTLGRRVRVDMAGRSVTGLAVDVDDTGALVLDTATGRRTVTAGDVLHLRAVLPRK
jgi:BirA family transcriptional regulator, biotin operon repressor / biotin---[acetyl-CoA-carboxylase] ligase